MDCNTSHVKLCKSVALSCVSTNDQIKQSNVVPSYNYVFLIGVVGRMNKAVFLFDCRYYDCEKICEEKNKEIPSYYDMSLDTVSYFT